LNFGGDVGVRCANALVEHTAAASAATSARFDSIRIRRNPPLSVPRARRGAATRGRGLQQLGDLLAVRHGPALHRRRGKN